MLSKQIELPSTKLLSYLYLNETKPWTLFWQHYFVVATYWEFTEHCIVFHSNFLLIVPSLAAQHHSILSASIDTNEVTEMMNNVGGRINSKLTIIKDGIKPDCNSFFSSLEVSQIVYAFSQSYSHYFSEFLLLFHLMHTHKMKRNFSHFICISLNIFIFPAHPKL